MVKVNLMKFINLKYYSNGIINFAKLSKFKENKMLFKIVFI